MTRPPRKILPRIEWRAIDTVLLDMDGTLLDRHFDDYFWLRFVPENYALTFGGSIEAAQKKLHAMFRAMEGTLDWTDLDFWSSELGLDIPALKVQIDALIQVHPYVIEFLDFCRTSGKRVHLVTNAHRKTLAIKMSKTALGGHFDQIVCAGEVGMAKEESRFWPKLNDILPYEPHRSLLADDTEAVLRSASEYGIRYLIHVARPSSRAEIRYSATYPSVVFFNELMGK